MPESSNPRTDSGPIPEHHLQDVFNNAPIGVFTSTPEGRYISANPALAGMFGYESPEELIASITDITTQVYVDPADREVFIRLMTEHGKVVEHECRFKRRDGTEFWVSRNVRAIRDEDGRVVAYQGFSTDITARKQAEGQLKRIEWMLSGKPISNIEARTEAHDQGYGDLTELNRDGIILKSIGPERLKSFANDYLELLDTSSAIYEANGDYAFGIFASGWCRMMDKASRNLCDTPDNAEALNSGRWLCHESCWTDCSKQAIAKRAPVDIECNGGLRLYAVPIFAGGNVIGAINFGYGDPPKDPEKLKMLADAYHLDHDDLLSFAEAYDSRPPYIVETAKKRLNSTARLIGSMVETKQAMEALQDSEETLRTTLHSIGDAVISTDMDGLVVAMNPVAESLTGWSEKEATGQALETVFRIINEQTRQPVESPAANVLKSGHIVGLANHTLLIAKDGREIPIADSGAPIRNDVGEITGVVLVFRDQTQEHAAREALEASEATIRNKLKAITEPDGDIGTLNLGDIIDTQELQTMMEDLFKISKVGGAILDISGKVLVSVKMEDICGKFHRVHPDTAKNCLESDLALASGVPAGTFKAYRCKNNMWDMVSPIKVGEKHLGNIYIGQFFYEDEHVDYELFRKQARRYGFDETEYLAALDRVPRLKRETVESAMTFYAKLSGMISSLSYSKIKLSRDIALRKQAEKALQEKNDLLERIFDSNFDLIALSDLEGNFTLVGKSHELLGYDSDYLIARNVMEFVHPEDAAFVGDEFSRFLKSGENRKVDYRYKRMDGEYLWFETIGTILTDKKGNPEQILFNTRNITERKQAEEALRESRELLNETQRIAKTGGWVWDEKIKSMTWTDETYRIHGMEPGELTPGSPEHIQASIACYDEKDQSKIESAFRRCVEKGTPYRFEFPITTVQGRRKWIRTSAQAVLESGEVAKVYGHMIDITERKQTEQALVEQKDLLSAIFRNAPLVIMVVNAERRIQQVNEFAAQYAGRDAEEMLGMRGGEALRCLHVLDDPRGCGFGEFCRQCVIRNAALDTLETGKTHLQVEAPYYFKGQDNETRELQFLMSTTPIQVKGERMVLVTLQDITERKRAEDTLIRQQRSINLSNRIANVFLTSSRDEVFADVLDLLLKTLDSRFGYFGYIDEAGDLVCPSLTRDVWDQCQVAEKSVVFPRARWGGLWGRSLMEKQTLIANENLQIPEGHVALESALATPIVYNHNLIGQFVVANKAGGYNKDDRDILESAAVQTAPILFAIQEEARRKKAHEKLEDQMRQAQKMESVGRLAGGVAHDFNNMLGVILGHAEMALEQIDPGQPFFADLQEIRKAAERSANLTRQLLTFARKQTISPRIIDLNETVEGMLKMLRRLIGEDIDLIWLPGKNLAPVKMDPSQIDQILANLCVNARDAIAGVGKLTIETGRVRFDEEYCADHAGFIPGEFILLAVSDNGCGMDPETVSHLFEPFFTTKEPGKGTGLGLASVYGAVKQNNGFINVYSEPGQGTTFRIYLPRHRAKTPLQAEKATAKPAAHGSETILLVEDEPAILRMARMMLERLGYVVVAAETPGEAIRLAHEHSGSIDLLMTDVVMPEMNGRDLAKNLLTIYPEIKRLFISGYTANVIAHHGVLDEGVYFIQKPFSLKDLGGKLREVLEDKNGE